MSTIDDEILAQLYRVLDERSARPPVLAGPRAVHERIRQRRSRVMAVRLVAAALVVVLAGGAAWVSQRHSSRTTEPAAPLIDQPVRGSLAHDPAFLAGVRKRAAGEGPLTIGRAVWKPPAPSLIRVLYAGDVGGYRFALVHGPWRHGAERGVWHWLVGHAGTPAGELLQGAVATGSPAVAVQAIQPGRLGDVASAGDRTGAALAIGVGDLDVRLAGPATYSSDGSVSLPLGAFARRLERGVYTAALPVDGSYRMAVDGRLDVGWGLTNRTTSDRNEMAQPGLTEPIPGSVVTEMLSGWTGSRPSRAAAENMMTATLLWSGLRLRDARFRLLAARDRASIFTIPRPRRRAWDLVIGVQAPSGAWFVGANSAIGGPPGLRGWTIRPADELDGLALAWNETWDAGLRLFPPVTAARAEFIGRRGQVRQTVLLADQRELNIIEDYTDGIASVRFLDAAGRAVGSAVMQDEDWVNEPTLPVMSWKVGEA